MNALTAPRLVANVERTVDVLRRWTGVPSPLTSVERARTHRFRVAADADDFVAAHLLAREVVALVAPDPIDACDVRIESRCSVCAGDDHGQPTVRGHSLGVSLSHTRGVVAAAAGSGRVGIDVERTGGGTDVVLASALTSAEATAVWASADPGDAFCWLWVRKEALVKVGAATLDSVGELDLSGLERMNHHRVATGRWGAWTLSGLTRDDLLAVAAVAAVTLPTWHRSMASPPPPSAEFDPPQTRS